ncbi:MAG: restriction endonuclease subunit S [Caldilineaceae bacterium]
MAVKQGYKQTEVGVIPEDWEITPLGRLIFSVEYGSSAKSNKKGNMPVLRMGNLQDGKIDWNDLVFTDDEFEIKKYRLNPGDVLFNRTNTIELVGKTAIYQGERPAIFAGYLIRANVDRTLLDPVFLNYVLNAEFSRKYSSKVLSVAVGQANINGQKLKTYPIPLPPTLAEQQAIAEALSDVDGMISALDALIAKKRAIKQGAMQELLTGQRRLPGFAGEWETTTVEQIAEVTTGDKDTQNKVDDGMYPFFVRSQVVERINSFSFDGEAVLTAGDGVGVGKVFHYINGKFDFHQRVYRISNFRDYDGRFFFWYFSSYFFREATRYNAKNSVDSVRREMITGMRIPLPSLAEQTAIAQILADMDDAIAALVQKRAKTVALKQGMMQALLTGQVRLV